MNDFDYDVSQKKKIAHSAKKRVGNRRGCRLQHDHLTNSQINKLNGEVHTVNINKPITYEEYKRMPDTLAQTYYASLVERFNVGSKKIASMMGIKVGTLTNYNQNHKIRAVTKGMRTPEQERAWLEFLDGGVITPAEEKTQPETATEAGNMVMGGTEQKIMSGMVGFHFTFTKVSDWSDILKLVGNMPLPEKANVIITVEAGE